MGRSRYRFVNYLVFLGLFPAFIVALPNQAEAQTIVSAQQDSTIRLSSPYQNYSSQKYLKVRSNGWNLNRALVKFDLSNEQASSIDSGELRLFVSSTNGSAAIRSISVHKMKDNWDDGSVSWLCSSRSGPRWWNCDYWSMLIPWLPKPYMTNPTVTFDVPKNFTGWVAVDVSSDLGELNNGDSVGWLLKIDNEWDRGGVQIHSSEHTNGPTLIIDSSPAGSPIEFVSPSDGEIVNTPFVAIASSTVYGKGGTASISANGFGFAVTESGGLIYAEISSADGDVVLEATSYLNNVSEFDVRSVVVDSISPVIEVTAPNGTTNSINFEFSVQDENLDDFELFVDGQIYSGGVISDGAHDWHIVATDLAGNSAESEAIQFILDTTPPVEIARNPSLGTLSSVGAWNIVFNETIVSSSVASDLTITIGSIQFPYSGTLVFDQNQIEGQVPDIGVDYEFSGTLFIADELGNATTTSVFVEVDAYAPFLQFAYDSTSVADAVTQISLSASVIENSLVSLTANGNPIDVIDDTFSIVVPLVYGANTVEFLAVDSFGRQYVKTIVISRELPSVTRNPSLRYIEPEELGTIQSFGSVTDYESMWFLFADGLDFTVDSSGVSVFGAAVSEGSVNPLFVMGTQGKVVPQDFDLSIDFEFGDETAGDYVFGLVMGNLSTQDILAGTLFGSGQNSTPDNGVTEVVFYFSQFKTESGETVEIETFPIGALVDIPLTLELGYSVSESTLTVTIPQLIYQTQIPGVVFDKPESIVLLGQLANYFNSPANTVDRDSELDLTIGEIDSTAMLFGDQFVFDLVPLEFQSELYSDGAGGLPAVYFYDGANITVVTSDEFKLANVYGFDNVNAFLVQNGTDNLTVYSTVSETETLTALSGLGTPTVVDRIVPILIPNGPRHDYSYVDGPVPDTFLSSSANVATDLSNIMVDFYSLPSTNTFECNLFTNRWFGDWFPCVANAGTLLLDAHLQTLQVRSVVNSVPDDEFVTVQIERNDVVIPNTSIIGVNEGVFDSTVIFESDVEQSSFDVSINGGPWQNQTIDGITINYLVYPDQVVDIKVRARTQFDRIDPTPTIWQVDTSVSNRPETYISYVTNVTVVDYEHRNEMTTITVSFSSNVTNAIYQCANRSPESEADWFLCSSEHSIEIDDKFRTLYVRAVANGLADLSPEFRPFFKFVRPDTVNILGEDEIFVQSGEQISFLFGRLSPVPTPYRFECRVGFVNEDWQSCPERLIIPPNTFGAVAPFTASIQVRAILDAPFGMTLIDQTPLDLTLRIFKPSFTPETFLIDPVPAVTPFPARVFEFGSDVSGASFLCEVNGNPFVCGNSTLVEFESEGFYTYRVTAVDMAGVQDGSPLEFTIEYNDGIEEIAEVNQLLDQINSISQITGVTKHPNGRVGSLIFTNSFDQQYPFSDEPKACDFDQSADYSRLELIIGDASDNIYLDSVEVVGVSGVNHFADQIRDYGTSSTDLTLVELNVVRTVASQQLSFASMNSDGVTVAVQEISPNVLRLVVGFTLGVQPYLRIGVTGDQIGDSVSMFTVDLTPMLNAVPSIKTPWMANYRSSTKTGISVRGCEDGLELIGETSSLSVDYDDDIDFQPLVTNLGDIRIDNGFGNSYDLQSFYVTDSVAEQNVELARGFLEEYIELFVDESEIQTADFRIEVFYGLDDTYYLSAILYIGGRRIDNTGVFFQFDSNGISEIHSGLFYDIYPEVNSTDVSSHNNVFDIRDRYVYSYSYSFSKISNLNRLTRVRDIFYSGDITWPVVRQIGSDDSQIYWNGVDQSFTDISAKIYTHDISGNYKSSGIRYDLICHSTLFYADFPLVSVLRSNSYSDTFRCNLGSSLQEFPVSGEYLHGKNPAVHLDQAHFDIGYLGSVFQKQFTSSFSGTSDNLSGGIIGLVPGIGGCGKNSVSGTEVTACYKRSTGSMKFRQDSVTPSTVYHETAHHVQYEYNLNSGLVKTLNSWVREYFACSHENIPGTSWAGCYSSEFGYSDREKHDFGYRLQRVNKGAGHGYKKAHSLANYYKVGNYGDDENLGRGAKYIISMASTTGDNAAYEAINQSLSLFDHEASPNSRSIASFDPDLINEDGTNFTGRTEEQLNILSKIAPLPISNAIDANRLGTIDGNIGAIFRSNGSIAYLGKRPSIRLSSTDGKVVCPSSAINANFSSVAQAKNPRNYLVMSRDLIEDINYKDTLSTQDLIKYRARIAVVREIVDCAAILYVANGQKGTTSKMTFQLISDGTPTNKLGFGSGLGRRTIEVWVDKDHTIIKFANWLLWLIELIINFITEVTALLITALQTSLDVILDGIAFFLELMSSIFSLKGCSSP